MAKGAKYRAQVVRHAFCEVYGTMPDKLTGTEVLGSRRRKFAAQVAGRLHVPVPRFPKRATLADAITHFSGDDGSVPAG